jgi:DNA-binding response OmpR family regulator
LQHRPIKVLLVDADEEYVEELQEGLGADHAGILEIEWVNELSQGLARLTQGGFDAVLLSMDLPDSRGMVTFDRAYAFAPDVPIVVVSDVADEDAAVSTVQAGAQDYIVKHEAFRAPRHRAAPAVLGPAEPLAHR